MTRVAKRKREDTGGEPASNEPGLGGTKKKEEKQDEILVPTNVMLRIASFITGSSSSSELPLAVIIYTGEALNELTRRSKIPQLAANILSHVADFIRDRKTYNALSMANKEIRDALTSKQFMPWPEMRLCEGPSINHAHFFYHMSDDGLWLYRFRFRWHSPEAEEDQVEEVKTGIDLDETPWCFRLTKWSVKTGRVMEETELSTVHADHISIPENWNAFAVWKLVGVDVDSVFHVYRFRNENGVLAFNPEQAFTVHPSLPRAHHNLVLSLHKSERTATALHTLDNAGRRGGIALALYDLKSGQEIKHAILDPGDELPSRSFPPTKNFSMICTDQFTLWSTVHGRFKIWPHKGSTSSHFDLGVNTQGVIYRILFPNPKNPNVIAALGVQLIGPLREEWMHLSSLVVNDPSTITSSRSSHGQLRNCYLYRLRRERQRGIQKQPLFGWFPCGKCCFFFDQDHFTNKTVRIFTLTSDNALEELPANRQTLYQTRFRTTVDAIFQKELSREEYLTKVQFEAEGKIVLVANRYGHTYIERLVNE